MADDLELLRLRAKAKLKLRQSQASKPQPDSAQPVAPAVPPVEEESWASRTARNLAPMSMAAAEAPTPAPREFNTSQRPSSFADFSTTRQDPNVGLAPILDAATLPARALAATRGMDMSDPGAYLLRPEAEQAAQNVEARNAANPWNGRAPTSFAEFGQNAAPGVAEVALQAASDPLMASPSRLVTAPARLAAAGSKTAKAAGDLGTNLASQLTDIPREALERAATKEGRERLQAVSGKDLEIGNRVLDEAERVRFEMPESRLVDEAFQSKNVMIPPEELNRVADAGNVAPRDPLAGYSPTERQAQDALTEWRNYMRGGEKPRDLAVEADRAAEVSRGRQIDAMVQGQAAEIKGKAASAAERKALSAQNKAAKAAGQSASARIKFLRDADAADKNVTRFGKARNESGAEAEAWLDEARRTSAKSRQESIDARAKLAAGKISQQDFDIAQAASEFAQREALVAETAKRIDKGQSLEDIGNQLARGLGMGVDDIADVLSSARNRVVSNAPPIQGVPAVNFRQRRMNLDFEMNYEKEFKEVGDKALGAMRKASKEALEKAAKDAGIEGYPEWMASMQKKLKTLEDFQRMAGPNKAAREARVESLIRNALGGANPEYKAQLFKDLEALGVGDFSEIRDVALARKLGEGGVAPWLPPQHNGSFMKALAFFKTAGTVGLGSPKVYTRVTLPAIRKAEAALAEASGRLSKKGEAALLAMSRTKDIRRKIALAAIIERELSNSDTTNTERKMEDK